jgi:CBS domain-containing protein
MDFGAKRKGRYSCANSVSKHLGESERPLLDRNITAEEIAQLCKPVADIFHKHTCYQAMGLSTQVVVVEVHSPLTVAFIAAQETKVAQCVLWDSNAKRFFGVLPTTEYIKILLYCEAHPNEKDTITKMSIANWLRKTEGTSKRPPLGGVVAAAPTESLQECFAKMVRHRVRRSLLVSEKDGGDASLVGVLTQEAILQYIASTCFSLDAADALLGEADGNAAGAATGSGVLPQRVKNIVLGFSPGMDRRSLLTQDDTISVGPYRDIMDVPISQLPALGKHRTEGSTNAVTMKTPVKDALKMLIDRNIHSVAVVDDYGIVIDIVSRNDVMRMETNGMYDINISVAEAIAFHVGGSIFVFHETDTVRDILVHFAQSKVRELYLVDPMTDKLMGQLSMSEFLRFLFNGSIEPTST